ncbi:hypothetical protein JRO89_XS01G0315600 [Xanthoceras sorbifolium]|uniref:Uncharacterized protein n=1 Tax=Xanthoceras sorbifolium TaxID=99658 RepID=A0ABQ8IMT3_9ROSI|nr:hypothetical protein JRO89_XS01G0315600 [Xanthoceras sorbifolium]
MGRTPCCDKKGLKKGPWTPEEDEILVEYIKRNGHGSWRSLPKLAGIMIYLSLLSFFFLKKNAYIYFRWAAIASQLPGRTDNEIKNLWNTHLKKRMLCMGIDPQTHEPFTSCGGPTMKAPASPTTRHMAQWESARLEAEARLSRESLLFNPPPPEKTDSDYFLRIWNSEVGESFRKLNSGDKTACQSPTSQASSSTKCGSVSAVTMDLGHNIAGYSTPASNQNEDMECKSPKSYTHDENVMPGSDTSSCNDSQDSSDSALQLLLDFPINNDMSFLEDNYATSSAMFTENSLICPL